MNMDLKKAIEEAREKLKTRKPAHVVDLEKGLRELKTELYIKRDEEKQLRADLDAANLELRNLRSALESAKKSSDEYQFNLNIMLKKSRGNEEELQEKREALMKIKLQHKMAVGEAEILKEKLLNVEMEKMDLSRKVDVFVKKQRHNTLYHDEILKRDNCLRNFVDELNEIIVKLQAEHIQATELSKKAQLGNEAIQKVKHFVSENEKLKKEKEHFEDMFIQVNAKYEKLTELMNRNENVNKPNLITQVIFNQWKINRTRHITQTREMDEVMSKISESLNSEKKANEKLIYENEKIQDQNSKLRDENMMLKNICEKNGDTIGDLNNKIKELEAKFEELEKASAENREIISVKQEPIEID